MHAVQFMESLVAAVPGLLGVSPVESLIVVTIRNGAAQCAWRIDLSDAYGDKAVDCIGELARSGGALDAVVVVVSAESAQCQLCASEFAELARGVGDVLERRGGELIGAVVVDQISVGGRWRCLDDCGGGGVLGELVMSDPESDAGAAGPRMYSSRDELKTVVAVDAERRDAVSPLLNGVGGDVEDVEAAVGGVVAAMRRMAGGVALTDAELATAGISLLDVRVRDSLFTLSESAEAEAATALWITLARVLPHPARCEALSLVAMSAYLRGEETLAGVMVEVTLEEAPDHRLAGLMAMALRRGIRPAEIRKVIVGTHLIAI